MDFRQIEAFVNVIRQKSFSRAADAIYLTQPTISAHINSLEKELGVKLIDRSGKDIEPTEAGILFYEYAMNLVNTRDNAIYSLNKYNNTIEGKLDIVASTVPSQIIVPRFIKEFSTKYENISFSITQMDSEQVIEAVTDKRFEIGIVGTRVSGNKLNCTHLIDDRLVLITPNSGVYSKWQQDTIPFSQLTKESFIIREAGSGTRKEFERIIKESGLSENSINIAAQMNSIEAIKQSVSIGLGVAIVSLLSVQDYLKYGLLRAYNIEGLDLHRAFYSIHLANRPLSPISRVFLEFINDTEVRGKVANALA